jgi:hypothetical protein
MFERENNPSSTRHHTPSGPSYVPLDLIHPMGHDPKDLNLHCKRGLRMPIDGVQIIIES